MKKIRKTTLTKAKTKSRDYGSYPIYDGYYIVGYQKFWNVRDKKGRFCKKNAKTKK